MVFWVLLGLSLETHLVLVLVIFFFYIIESHDVKVYMYTFYDLVSNPAPIFFSVSWIMPFTIDVFSPPNLIVD